MEGGQLDQQCGELHQKLAAVFTGIEKTRQMCTPFLDLTAVGSISFYFMFGK